MFVSHKSISECVQEVRKGKFKVEIFEVNLKFNILQFYKQITSNISGKIKKIPLKVGLGYVNCYTFGKNLFYFKLYVE